MADLRVNVAGVEFSNPLIAASGTFGFGHEYNEFYPPVRFGGISCKGITIKERPGNPPPRVTETPSGMLNAVGLQNPGVDHFIEHDLPWLAEQGTKIIANVAGNAPEDYCATVEKLNDTCVDMVELNISCPNVKQGGVQFGTTTEGVYGITSEVRKHCKKPLMVKLSPNVTDISEMAVAAESAGADALSMINTLTGMRIDIRTRRPIIRNNTGGLSGPAVLPVALRMVWQASQKVKIPIVGLGGISTWQDAVEMLLAGATALQIGTVLFTDPYAPLKIAEGLSRYMDENGIQNLSELTGGCSPVVTTLYIIRHCQSAGNAGGRFQGRFDGPVNEQGEKQLDLLSLRFRNEHLDAICSSPLVRAYRTAEAVNKFHGLPIHKDEGLLEIDVGEMENKLLSHIGQEYPQLAANWDHAPDLCVFPGGETMAQVYQRVGETIARITEDNLGKTVAVITHGGFIKNLYARVQFGSIQGLRQSAVFGNTSVSILEVEDGVYRWKSVNDMSHLPVELQKAPMQYSFHTEAL